MRTTGDTTRTVGNATRNANSHAFNQMAVIPLTKPILKVVITKDIKHDMSNAIKNENTYEEYLLGIIISKFLSLF